MVTDRQTNRVTLSSKPLFPNVYNMYVDNVYVDNVYVDNVYVDNVLWTMCM